MSCGTSTPFIIKDACPEVQVKAVHVDFSKGEGTFSLGEQFKLKFVTVSWVTCRGAEVIVEKHIRKQLDGDGEFSLTFTKDASDLRVNVDMSLSFQKGIPGCCVRTSVALPAPPTDKTVSVLNYLGLNDEWEELKLFQMIRDCNQFALNTSGRDHDLSPPQQGGPCRASRAIGIVHIAMSDAANSITRQNALYSAIPFAPATANVKAAIAQAARDTLVWLFSKQTALIDAHLASQLSLTEGGVSKTEGINAGKAAAAAIIAARTGDGSQVPDPRTGDAGAAPLTTPPLGDWNTPGIGNWSELSSVGKDFGGLALGRFWPNVKTFSIPSASSYRCPSPFTTFPINGPAYAAAFNEVRGLGGDGDITVTTRTEDQTDVGLFWAYDGTPTLCAPNRLYNQVAVHIAIGQRTLPAEFLRLLAVLNTAFADTAIGSWDSKYYWCFWRPVTGVRDNTTAPNNGVAADTNYTPFGAPASNTNSANFTPPFPAYPSGHACFGGALFQTLRNFYKTDKIPFTFVSDELNGVTEQDGVVRPLKPRSFVTLSQAEQENSVSRVYLGIHWNFDYTEGMPLGHKVADQVYKTKFLNVEKK